jgi:UDP:flavonoid glycosyltransferase YjiC (YdhE family)
MRVLMVSAPGAGHVFPLVPLAWALCSTGHDVLLASTSIGVTLGSGAGLLTTDVAPDIEMERVFRAGGPATAFDGAQDRDHRAAAMALFTEVNRAMLDGLRRCARAWRPDVVVYGNLETAGAVVAAELAVPGVEHALSPAAPIGLMNAAIWPRIADSEPVSPAAGIGIVPPSIAPTPTPGWAQRAVPYNGSAVIPDGVTDPPQRPRVLVTMGTVAPRMGGVGVVRELLDAVAQEPVDVLVALGLDPAELGPLPPSVRAYPWLPLTAALPHCAAVVHHGGAGTMISALAFGVPQVIVPRGADQFSNAATIERRGCGLQAGADPAAVRAALRRALAGEFGAAVAEVRAEIEALPTPAEVANELVALIRAC